LLSCVSNKQLVFLQDSDMENADIDVDTVVNQYDPKTFEYRLKPEDIISLKVGSVTPSEFDFIEEYEQQLGIIRKLNQYSQGAGSGQNQGGGNLNQLRNLNLNQNQRVASGFLPNGFILDKQGALELPKIGRVSLLDLTLDQAEEKVENLLEGYFESPIVRIQLLSFHFTILGEVNNAGRYTSFDPQTSIIDAIAIGGNLSELADRSRIKIVRKDDNGQFQTIYVNLLNEKLLASDYYYIKAEDMIIVSPLKAREFQRYTLPRVGTILGFVSSALTVAILVITLNN